MRTEMTRYIQIISLCFPLRQSYDYQVGYTLTSSTAPFYNGVHAVGIPGATDQSTMFCKQDFTVLLVIQMAVRILRRCMFWSALMNQFRCLFLIYRMFHRDFHSWNFWQSSRAEINVLNTLGQIVFSEEEKNLHNHFTKSFDFTSLPASIYFLEVKAENRKVMRCFVKQ
jgi:hypothetical protein